MEQGARWVARVTLGPQLAGDDETVGLRAVGAASAKALGGDNDCHVERLVRCQVDLMRRWEKRDGGQNRIHR